MKKITKKKQRLFGKKIVFIVDKNLNKLKAEELAPEKLAMANEHLRKIKSLPK
jgi:hypothetical protein